MKTFKLTRPKHDPFDFDAHVKDSQYGTLRAFSIHEDLLLSLIGQDNIDRLDDGEEIEFRMEEVKGEDNQD